MSPGKTRFVLLVSPGHKPGAPGRYTNKSQWVQAGLRGLAPKEGGASTDPAGCDGSIEDHPGVRVPALIRGESLDGRSEAALGITDSSPPEFGARGVGQELGEQDGEEVGTSDLNHAHVNDARNATTSGTTTLPDERQRTVMREAPAADREQSMTIDWGQVCSEVGTSRWYDIS